MTALFSQRLVQQRFFDRPFGQIHGTARLRTVKGDALRVISKLSLFAGLGRRQLRSIARLTELRSVPRGEVLIEEGSLGRDFFVLVEGKVAVRKGRRSLAVLASGDFFGEVAAVGRTRRTATVSTLEDSVVAVLGAVELDALLEEEPRIALVLLRAVLQRMEQRLVHTPRAKAKA